MICLQARNLEWQPSSGTFRLRITDFSLATGDKISIVGPSGAGKSTFLGLLSFALRPTKADLFRLTTNTKHNYDIAALWRAGKPGVLANFRSHFIGFIPQTSALLPFLTAQENIVLPIQVTKNNFDKNRFTYLIDRLDLQNCLSQYPASLSVGQRQRVAVARALVTAPPLILADEPTASVPPEQATIIYNMLLNAPDSAVIMVTHDRENARREGFTLVEAKANGQHTTMAYHT
ncbi:ABC transporter ATP-binding protein [Acetobacter persici]|uniref:ABC transporter ATP-binding protein n=1 Tax=Acetobacter persici TaxID=1076596 RepID=UPI001BAADB07|nr:ATP-binding cassette domain-containing protein [Acetobacter persici]MBS1016970.1 ATP-binding cassette domain-containing protein [Acetobacter persici]